MPAFLLPILALVPSWLWKYIGIGLVGVAIFVAGDIRGARVANEKCAAAARKAQVQADKVDTRADKDTRTDESDFAKQATEQKRIDDAEMGRLRDELAKRPVPERCVLTGPDADSLWYDRPASRTR
jgi:hypothetical protein